MLERHLQIVRTDDAREETPAAIRDRLKSRFPAGATRRMTTLGLLVGGCLLDTNPGEADVVVYASSFGESLALESFLASFPSASPTLFQTSIHPSAVQQTLIGRQQAIREFFPLAGDQHLPLHALLTAMLSPAERAIVCGGEERGTWLREHGVASARSFAFAMVLTRAATPTTLGTVRLHTADTHGAWTLGECFDAIHGRRSQRIAAGPGWEIEWSWQ